MLLRVHKCVLQFALLQLRMLGTYPCFLFTRNLDSSMENHLVNFLPNREDCCAQVMTFCIERAMNKQKDSIWIPYIENCTNRTDLLLIDHELRK